MFPIREQVMRLIGLKRINCLLGKTPETDIWLSAWINEMKTNTWLDAQRIIKSYPSAQYLEPSVFIFAVSDSGSSIRLTLCFTKRVAVISDVINSYE